MNRALTRGPVLGNHRTRSSPQPPTRPWRLLASSLETGPSTARFFPGGRGLLSPLCS